MPLFKSESEGLHSQTTINLRDASSCERLEEGQFLAIVTFLEDILSQMRVGREVNSGEGNVAKETRRRALIETKNTQLANNVDSALGFSTVKLGCFSLDLETDLTIQECEGPIK